MKRLELKPSGFPCTLSECEPGFFLFNDELCFKSKYTNDDGTPDAYCESGESFWGGVSTVKELRNIIVQPLFSELVIE
jgi:hypothetical protein